MKILLINNNPVVSRLTALSARKEDIAIDEIQEVTELNSDKYDIVFVDADSWTKDVSDVISENIKTQKTVLFYGDGDDEEKNSFDISILKPFLPSEVSAVIRSVEASSEDLDEADHFNVLEDNKIETKNEALELDELNDTKEELSLNLDDDLDLDSTFDEKLEEEFSLNKNSLDDDLLDDNDLFDLDLKEETSSLDNDLFAEEEKEDIAMETEKFDLEDDTLTLEDTPKEEVSHEGNLPLELDELLVEETKAEELKVEAVKKETKILDEQEIENIKGILTEETSEEMTLEELMPPMSVMPSISESVDKEESSKETATDEEMKKEKSKKEKSKKDKVKAEKVAKEENDDSFDFDTNVLSQTLAAMPVENLRQLLSGAKVNITIKFPKSKK